jgi:hypothetical protein
MIKKDALGGGTITSEKTHMVDLIFSNTGSSEMAYWPLINKRVMLGR